MGEKKYTKYRFIVQGLWLFVIIIQYYLPFAVSPLMQEIMTDFSIDYAQAGLLITIVAIIGGISMFGTNGIIQKLGLKKGVICALLSFLIGNFISVFAPNYMILMIGRAFIGVGYGLTAAFNGALAVAWFPPKEQPFINTMNSVVATLGQTMAFGITIPLHQVVGSWQRLFMFTGLITAIIFVLWCVLGRESETTQSERTVGQPQETAQARNGIWQALWL